MKGYQTTVDIYTDTRMGATNPKFDLTTTISLKETEKQIKNYLTRNNKDRKFRLSILFDSEGKWVRDFNPEIITVREIELK